MTAGAVREAAERLVGQVRSVVVGKDRVVEQLFAALLTGCLLYTSDAADE